MLREEVFEFFENEGKVSVIVINSSHVDLIFT